MASIVECTRKGERLGVSFFSWKQLLDAAEAHGWKPEGAVYCDDLWNSHEKAGKPADYAPEEALYSKTVSAEDAANLARGLRAAAESPELHQQTSPTVLSETASVDDLVMLNATLPVQAQTLAAFAAKGAFNFAADD